MTRIPASPAAIAALSCLFSLSVPAQNGDGSYWSEYPAPANVTNFRSIGTIAMIETPTDYHFFSGLHRSWLVHPVTAPTVIGVANAYCLFRDGTTIFAYSTRTAEIAALPTSGSAVVSMGSLSSSWTAYVLDGNTVHGYSAFRGEWVPLPVASASPSVALNSHVISCDDGTTLSAFSAFFGTWESTPSSGATGIYPWRNGVLATYAAPDQVRSFSSYTNQWATQSGFDSTGGTFNGQDGYCAVSVNGGADVLWHSALRGTFVESHEPLGTTVQFGRNCGVVLSPVGLSCYSPGTGAVTPIPTAGTPNVLVAGGFMGTYALIDDGASLRAFNGMSGSLTPAPLYLPYTYTLGDTAAMASDATGIAYAFSALRDEWAAAPVVVASAVNAQFEGIVRTVPGGYEGYSARTGTFATLNTTGSLAFSGSASTFGVIEPNGVQVFDPRYGRWEAQPTGASPQFGVFRLTAMARDATKGYGYSIFTNEWQEVPLQGIVQTSGINSSIAWIITSSHYYILTANGSLSNYSRFPEFTRFSVLGQPLEHLQAGNPGAYVLGLFSLTDAEASTPFGTLRVDPNPLVLGFGFVPPNGLLRTTITLPDIPAFRGIVLYMQDFLLRPNGDFALSNGQAPFLW